MTYLILYLYCISRSADIRNIASRATSGIPTRTKALRRGQRSMATPRKGRPYDAIASGTGMTAAAVEIVTARARPCGARTYLPYGTLCTHKGNYLRRDPGKLLGDPGGPWGNPKGTLREPSCSLPVRHTRVLLGRDGFSVISFHFILQWFHIHLFYLYSHFPFIIIWCCVEIFASFVFLSLSTVS